MSGTCRRPGRPPSLEQHLRHGRPGHLCLRLQGRKSRSSSRCKKQSTTGPDLSPCTTQLSPGLGPSVTPTGPKPSTPSSGLGASEPAPGPPEEIPLRRIPDIYEEICVDGEDAGADAGPVRGDTPDTPA